MPRDRSRSPRGRWTSDKLSRLLVQFGRYPHKRPTGLEVDDGSCFRLQNLMDTWGNDEGLSEEDILASVKENMFHEDGHELRFCIDNDSEGYLTIRVMDKRRKGRRRQEAVLVGQASKRDWQPEPEQAWDRDDRCWRRDQSPEEEPAPKRAEAPRRPQQPEGNRGNTYERHRPRGSVGKIPLPVVPPWRKAPTREPPPDELSPKERPGTFVDRLLLKGIPASEASTRASDVEKLSTEDKLDMPLDALTELPDMTICMARGIDRRARDDKVRQAFGQMGLTPETSSIRLSPNKSGRDGKRGRAKGQEDRSSGEKLTRWLSWVFKSGHRELQIGLRDDGCILIAELAAAMSQKKKEWYGYDSEKLRDALKTGDVGGRFEVVGESLRRVPKEERAAPMSLGTEGGTGNHRERSRERSASSASSARWRRRSVSGGSSPSSGRKSRIPGDDEDVESSICRQVARANISSPKLSPARAESGAADSSMQLDGGSDKPSGQEPPPSPPGDHWMQYMDVQASRWWYYEGPCGLWWCWAEGDEPKPYSADDV